MSFSPFSIHLSFHECLQYNSIVQSTCKMIDMILSVPSFIICPYIPSWRNIAPASAFAIEHALLKNKSPSLMNMKSIAVLLIMLGVSWEKIFYEELNFYHILVQIVFLPFPLQVKTLKYIKSMHALFSPLFSLKHLSLFPIQ